MSATAKHELRRRLRARRDVVSPEEAAEASAAIEKSLLTLLHPDHILAGFSATRGEVNLASLYEGRLARAEAVCFPRVEGPGALVFVPVRAMSDLREGAFGIAEPVGSAIALASIDAFLVPALAFDRRGMRLGFGGGFYDRVLRKRLDAGDKVPLFVGIGYSFQVLDNDLPADDWDVPVHSIVSEQGVIQIS